MPGILPIDEVKNSFLKRSDEVKAAQDISNAVNKNILDLAEVKQVKGMLNSLVDTIKNAASNIFGKDSPLAQLTDVGEEAFKSLQEYVTILNSTPIPESARTKNGDTASTLHSQFNEAIRNMAEADDQPAIVSAILAKSSEHVTKEIKKEVNVVNELKNKVSDVFGNLKNINKKVSSFFDEKGSLKDFAGLIREVKFNIKNIDDSVSSTRDKIVALQNRYHTSGYSRQRLESITEDLTVMLTKVPASRVKDIFSVKDLKKDNTLDAIKASVNKVGEINSILENMVNLKENYIKGMSTNTAASSNIFKGIYKSLTDIHDNISFIGDTASVNSDRFEYCCSNIRKGLYNIISSLGRIDRVSSAKSLASKLSSGLSIIDRMDEQNRTIATSVDKYVPKIREAMGTLESAVKFAKKVKNNLTKLLHDPKPEAKYKTQIGSTIETVGARASAAADAAVSGLNGLADSVSGYTADLSEDFKLAFKTIGMTSPSAANAVNCADINKLIKITESPFNLTESGNAAQTLHEYISEHKDNIGLKELNMINKLMNSLTGQHKREIMALAIDNVSAQRKEANEDMQKQLDHVLSPLQRDLSHLELTLGNDNVGY